MAKSGSPDSFLERIKALMESNEKRQALLADSECLNGMCMLLENPHYSSTLLSVFIQLADTSVDENANYGAHELSKFTELRTGIEKLRKNTQPSVAEKANQLHNRLVKAEATGRTFSRFDSQAHLAMRVNVPDAFSPFSSNVTKTQRDAQEENNQPGSGQVGNNNKLFMKKSDDSVKAAAPAGAASSPSVKFISVASASTRSVVLQLNEAVDESTVGDCDRSVASPTVNEVERAKQAILRVRGVVSIQTDTRKRRLTVRLSRELHVARLASAIRVQTGLEVAQVLRASNGVDEELVQFDRLATDGGKGDDPRYLDETDLFDAGAGSDAGRTAIEEYGSVIKETTAVWLGKAVSFLSNAFW